MPLTSYAVDEKRVALLRLERARGAQRDQHRRCSRSCSRTSTAAREDDEVRVLVISSTDHIGLSAGADVREELDEEGRVRRMELFARPLRRAHGLPEADGRRLPRRRASAAAPRSRSPATCGSAARTCGCASPAPRSACRSGPARLVTLCGLVDRQVPAAHLAQGRRRRGAAHGAGPPGRPGGRHRGRGARARRRGRRPPARGGRPPQARCCTTGTGWSRTLAGTRAAARSSGSAPAPGLPVPWLRPDLTHDPVAASDAATGSQLDSGPGRMARIGRPRIARSGRLSCPTMSPETAARDRRRERAPPRAPLGAARLRRRRRSTPTSRRSMRPLPARRAARRRRRTGAAGPVLVVAADDRSARDLAGDLRPSWRPGRSASTRRAGPTTSPTSPRRRTSSACGSPRSTRSAEASARSSSPARSRSPRRSPTPRCGPRPSPSTEGESIDLDDVAAAARRRRLRARSTRSRSAASSRSAAASSTSIPATEERAVRVELFGDEIESMRWFSTFTQRSLGEAERVELARAELAPSIASWPSSPRGAKGERPTRRAAAVDASGPSTWCPADGAGRDRRRRGDRPARCATTGRT